MLETKDLVVGYGNAPIVRGISIVVDKGEMVALLGPNGSGKSTFIKGIVGLARVFSGEVIYEGTDITGVSADKLVKMGIGYVPQLNNVFLSLTVEENLEMGAYIRRGESRVKEDIENIYELFPELRRHRRSKASNLSGGERQLLAVGRALMSKPRLLILDEPTASLSPKAASLILSKLVELKELGISILIAEQNALKTLQCSDRAYILVSGECIAEGYSKDILSSEELCEMYLGLKSMI